MIAQLIEKTNTDENNGMVDWLVLTIGILALGLAIVATTLGGVQLSTENVLDAATVVVI